MTKINRQEIEKYFESLRPDIERLIRKVDANPQACIIGMVFSQDPPCLMYMTSLETAGDELIKMHLVLSTLVAESKEHPEHTRVPFREFYAGDAKFGQAPEELADELARMVLVTGMDEKHIDRILHIAQQYLIARRPEN